MGESLNAPHSAAAAQTLVSADGGKAEKMTPAQRNTLARRLARLGSKRARLQKRRPVAVVH